MSFLETSAGRRRASLSDVEASLPLSLLITAPATFCNAPSLPFTL